MTPTDHEAPVLPSPSAPSGRDLLAALLWAAVPLAFVLGLSALGIPYEPLEGAPERVDSIGDA